MTLDDFLRAFEALVDVREDSDDPGEGNYGCEDCRACNNCRFCIGCDSCEDCTYCEESLDCTSCTQSKRCVGCKKVSYCEDSRDCKESRYLTLCVDCSDCVHCLACVGLEGGEFYVLNQKRTRKEYFALLRQVQELMLARMDGGWRPPSIGLASDIFDQIAATRDSELSTAPWLAEMIELEPEPEPEPESYDRTPYQDILESERTVQRSMPTRPEPTRDYSRDPDYGRPRDYPRESDYSRPRDYSRESDYSRPREPPSYSRDTPRERTDSRPIPRRPPPREDYRREPEPKPPVQPWSERGRPEPREREPERDLRPPSSRPSNEGWQESESYGRPARAEDSGKWMREPPAFGTSERSRPSRRPRQDYGRDLGQELGTGTGSDYDEVSRSESSRNKTQTFERSQARYVGEGYDERPAYEDSSADVPGPRTKEQPTAPFTRSEERERPSSPGGRPRLNTPRPPVRAEVPPAIEEGAPSPRAQEPSSPWIEDQTTQAKRVAKRGSLRRAGRPKRPSASTSSSSREGTGSDSHGSEGTSTGLRLGRKPKRR